MILSAVIDVWLDLAPWFLLGMVVAGVLHGFVPPTLLKRAMGGILGPVKAVALGVPLPLCSCGVIPAAVGLKKDGASNGSAIAFVISTPQTGVDSILVSASFLGWPFAVFKVVSAALTGVLGGVLTQVTEHSSGTPDHTAAKDLERISQAEATSTSNRTVKAMVGHAMETLETIWHWLLFGVIVSALISAYVPESVWASMSSFGYWGTAGMVLVISVPLYVCATASVPIAAAFVAGGMPLGAALVFLMAGPATNVATMGTILRTFGKRAFAIYLSTIVVSSMALGKAFDFVIQTPETIVGHSHSSHHWVSMLSGGVLLLATLWVGIRDLRNRMLRFKKVDQTREHMTLAVSGMTCGGCVNKVSRILNELDDVHGVKVELEAGKADVYGTPAFAAVETALKEHGFQAKQL